MHLPLIFSGVRITDPNDRQAIARILQNSTADVKERRVQLSTILYKYLAGEKKPRRIWGEGPLWEENEFLPIEGNWGTYLRWRKVDNPGSYIDVPVRETGTNAFAADSQSNDGDIFNESRANTFNIRRLNPADKNDPFMRPVTNGIKNFFGDE